MGLHENERLAPLAANFHTDGHATEEEAQVGPYRIFILCPEHQTREHVAGLFKVGEIWES